MTSWAVEILAALLLIPALATYFAVTGFMVFAIMVTKLHDHDYKLTIGWRVALLLALIGAVVGDIIYNATVGVVRYREWPREIAYSGRVRRHYKKHDQSDWRCVRAQIDADLLNTILPGHIDP